MRTATAIAVAFVVVAAPAAACIIIPETMPDGSWESPEAYYFRSEVAAQKRAWARADYVFLAQVRSLRVVNDYENDAGLRPVITLKGGDGPSARYHRYRTGAGNSCGAEFSYPAVGELGVFYANKTPWWRRWAPWSRMEIEYVVPVRSAFDPRLPIEMRAAAARLRKSQRT